MKLLKRINYESFQTRRLSLTQISFSQGTRNGRKSSQIGYRKESSSFDEEPEEKSQEEGKTEGKRTSKESGKTTYKATTSNRKGKRNL